MPAKHMYVPVCVHAVLQNVASIALGGNAARPIYLFFLLRAIQSIKSSIKSVYKYK